MNDRARSSSRLARLESLRDAAHALVEVLSSEEPSDEVARAAFGRREEAFVALRADASPGRGLSAEERRLRDEILALDARVIDLGSAAAEASRRECIDLHKRRGALKAHRLDSEGPARVVTVRA